MIKVRSLLLGDRIDIKGLENKFDVVNNSPLTLKINDDGYMILFKYGVIISFNLDNTTVNEFITRISHLIQTRYDEECEETANIIISDDESVDAIDKNGDIILKSFTILKAGLIANVLARATILDYYENHVTKAIDIIEPMINTLQNKKNNIISGKALSKIIADVMLTYTKTTGRIGIGEKPDELWDNPELDRFYLRISNEYELGFRDNSLNRKLEVMSKAAETLLGLDQHRYSVRLEWYIILLIVIEVCIMILSEILH